MEVLPKPVSSSGGVEQNGEVRFTEPPVDTESKKMSVGDRIKGYARKACTVQNMRKKLPITLWLPKYRPSWLVGDIVAGLTVGLTVIPQGLAYAQIAELPPQYGLYSAFMGCFVYCLLGTSKDITLGPTAIMSLMTADFAHSPIPGDATYAIILTLACGIVQFLLGVFHLGFLVNFIAYPVINGFTSAAAIVIAFGQVRKVLGLKNIPREFLEQVYETFHRIPETNVWDLTMGLVCIALLVILKKIKDLTDRNSKEDENPTMAKRVARKIVWLVGTARNAIVVIAASGVAAGLLAVDIDPFTLTGRIDPGLPPFKAPEFSINASNVTRDVGQVFSDIGAGFAIIPLIGLLETIAIGSAFARVNNYRIDASQELIAIGAANMLSSFVGSYPVTGSFSRTAVNSQSGVKTPGGGIVTGALVILALLLLTPYFQYIPDAALAGVIIAAVLQMVDIMILVKLWKVKKIDLIPLVVTFILSFILGIEYGIMVGIGVSLLILLFPYARPNITNHFYGSRTTTEHQIENTSHKLNGLSDANQTTVSDTGVIIIKLDQGLRFPGIDYLKQKVLDKSWTPEGERMSCVIDCAYLTALDYTSVQGISQLYDDFARHGAHIVLANVTPGVMEVLVADDIKKLRCANSVDEAIQMIYENISMEERSLSASSTRQSYGAVNNGFESDSPSNANSEDNIVAMNPKA